LLQIGNGTYPEDEDGVIELPAEIRSSGDLITEIFGERISINDVGNLAEKAILAPKNIHVAHMNELSLQRMPEELELKIYKSVDEAEYSDLEDVLNYPIDFLNQLSPGGMPPHELRLKQGCIVMLLRNLDIAKSLCNGTRLIVDHCGRFVLGCRFAKGISMSCFLELTTILMKGFLSVLARVNSRSALPLQLRSTRLKDRPYQVTKYTFLMTFFLMVNYMLRYREFVVRVQSEFYLPGRRYAI
ncbi:hypothetical protein V3C99_006297, partial [Haemonchus contortus]